MLTTEQVQKLREKSGAGILDCKKALDSSGGDVEKAIQFLREKGKATAEQKSGRSTAEGLVCVWVSADARNAGMVEVSCESDFVARTAEFQNFTKRIARLAGEKSVGSVETLTASVLPDGKETVESALKEIIGTLGENMRIKRAAHFSSNGGSWIGSYVHAAFENAPECGSLGVILELGSEKDSPEVRNLLRELCLQVAAASPRWIGTENVPPEIVDKELAIYKEQCRQSQKPEKAWDRILEGKLKDFYKMFCLLEQSHIKDSSGKTSVRALLDSVQKQTGAALTVKNFVRFKKGEE